MPHEEAVALLTPRALADGLPEQETATAIQSAYNGPKREPAMSAGGFSDVGTKLKSGKSTKYLVSVSDSISPSGENVGIEPIHATAELLPDELCNPWETLLRKGFEEGEFVACVPARGDEGVPIGQAIIRTREDWLAAAVAREPLPQFYCINPVSKDGRKLENVTAYRNFLIEIDKGSDGEPVSLEKQYGIINASGLPLTALSFSGNKSMHGLVNLGASNADEFAERARIIKALIPDLDNSATSVNNLSRVPGSNPTFRLSRRRERSSANGIRTSSMRRQLATMVVFALCSIRETNRPPSAT